MPSTVDNSGTEENLLINQSFAGKQRHVPFFNRSNNQDLIIAIQSAGVSRRRNVFRKDNSGNDFQFDTLYIGAEKIHYW